MFSPEALQDARATGTLFNLVGMANARCEVFELFPETAVKVMEGVPQFALVYEGVKYVCQLVRVGG